MINRLGFCESAGMAGRTVVSNCYVLMKAGRGKIGIVDDIVTRRAIQGRRNVGRVGLGIPPGCYDTVVTGRTISSDQNDLMKDATGKGTPGVVVANITIFHGHHVADSWLRGRRNTMTGIAPNTRIRNYRAVVVDEPFGKISRVMAHSTIGSGIRVGTARRDGRLTDRLSNLTSVGGITTGGQDNGIRVVDHRWYKGASNVTDTTILSSKDMAGTFLGHRSHSTITMTFCAVINPAGMIEYGVGESTASVMAHPAIGGGIRVGADGLARRLSYGPDKGIINTPIMARGAIVRNTRVQKRCYRRSETEISHRMAKVTILDGRQMAD